MNDIQLTEQMTNETAYHEAGHAVIGHLLGDQPVSVSIVSERRKSGIVCGKTNFAEAPAFACKGYWDQSPEKKR